MVVQSVRHGPSVTVVVWASRPSTTANAIGVVSSTANAVVLDASATKSKRVSAAGRSRSRPTGALQALLAVTVLPA
jgi:hypothetical protein